MVLEIGEITNKEEAEEYMVFQAIELGGTINVPKKNFDEQKYRWAKGNYERKKKLLFKEYSTLDTRACDKVISELENLIESLNYFDKK